MKLFKSIYVFIFSSLGLWGAPHQYLPIYEGVEYKEVVRYRSNKVNDDRVRVHVVKIDLGADGVDFVVTEAVEGGEQTKALKTSSFLREKGLQVAIAGSGYGYKYPLNEQEGTLMSTVTYAVSKGKEYGHFDGQSDAALIVMNDGKVGIFKRDEVKSMEQEEIKVGLGGWRDGETSALIVEDGQVMEANRREHLKRRTAVGMSKDGKTLYLVVVDGEPAKGFWYSDLISVGMSIRQLGEFMAEIGCWRAINLDGSESSSMVLEGEEGPMIVNLFSDYNTKVERSVGTNLGIFAKKLGTEGALNLAEIQKNSEALRLERDRLDREGTADFKAYLDQTPAFNLISDDFWGMMELDEDHLSLEDKKLVAAKTLGSTKGGIYRGKDGVVWFVKKAQHPKAEFLASVIMNVLFGNRTPVVKLVDGKGDLVASRNILGFIQKEIATEDIARYGEGALTVALDWLGVVDRHDHNMGYIVHKNGLEATRVDYDHSFSFAINYGIDDTKLYKTDLKADYLDRIISQYRIEDVIGMLESIRDLPDDVLIKLFDISLKTLEDNNFEVRAKDIDKIFNDLIGRKHNIGKLCELVEKDGRYSLASRIVHDKELKIEKIVITKEEVDFIFNHFGMKLMADGRIDVIKFLVAQGADVKGIDSSNLRVVAARSSLEMIKFLTENGAKVKEMNGKDLGFVAARASREMIKFLIQNGATAKGMPDYYLVEIGVSNDIDMMKLLIENGANIKSFSGFDLLAFAKHEDTNMIKLVLENGADVTRMSTNNLLEVAKWGRVDLMKLLIDKGADVSGISEEHFRDLSSLEIKKIIKEAQKRAGGKKDEL